MYAKTAQYYDRIYDFKDYAAEAAKLLEFIDRHQSTGGRRLLDVACGTGLHLEHLKRHADAEGLDLEPELLRIARERNPELTFHEGDMRTFSVEARYDTITCLFSSIGYMTTVEDLHRAIACMAGHLVPGGLLLIEPWFTPEQWMPNTVHAELVDEPDLKIARVNTSLMDGRVSIVDLHHLIATPQETTHVVEKHRLGLYTVEEMTTAFAAADLAVEYDGEGLIGRGLYIARAPEAA